MATLSLPMRFGGNIPPKGMPTRDRNIYHLNSDVNPRMLNSMVKYVRRELAHLETIPDNKFLRNGAVEWGRPLKAAK